MYAKLKPNGQIQLAPNRIVISVANPKDDDLERAGYRKVIETDPPEYNPETQYIDSHYVVSGDNILQVWEVHDNEVVEEVPE